MDSCFCFHTCIPIILNLSSSYSFTHLLIYQLLLSTTNCRITVTKKIGKEDVSLLIEDDTQEEEENSQFGTCCFIQIKRIPVKYLRHHYHRIFAYSLFLKNLATSLLHVMKSIGFYLMFTSVISAFSLVLTPSCPLSLHFSFSHRYSSSFSSSAHTHTCPCAHTQAVCGGN